MYACKKNQKVKVLIMNQGLFAATLKTIYLLGENLELHSFSDYIIIKYIHVKF